MLKNILNPNMKKDKKNEVCFLHKDRLFNRKLEKLV